MIGHGNPDDEGPSGLPLSSAFVEPFAAWMDRPGMIVERYLVRSSTLIYLSSSPLFRALRRRSLKAT